MSALPSNVQARINLDPRNKQRTWIEDIEVKVGKKVAYFSVEVDHDLDVDGNARVCGVLYDGQAIVLPPGIVDLIERDLEGER